MRQAPMIPLNDGHLLAHLGYGVWQVPDDVAESVVTTALEAGYRHIDTASAYRNEAGVGRAVRDWRGTHEPGEAGDVVVATKLWNADQGYESTIAAADASRARLGVDVIDLYLIHWCLPSIGLYVDTWRAFVDLRERGVVRSIGICNFPEPQLEEIIAATDVVPAVHQIELHPYYNQARMRRFNADRGIVTQAWSPLGQGHGELTDAVILRIADRLEATPAQVILAWHLANGVVPLPKSVTPARIAENLASIDLRLSDDDVGDIDALDNGGRLGADPAVANHLVPGAGGLPQGRR